MDPHLLLSAATFVSVLGGLWHLSAKLSRFDTQIKHLDRDLQEHKSLDLSMSARVQEHAEHLATLEARAR